MTSVPKGSIKNNPTRKYSLWAWIKAYTALIVLFPVFATLWLVSITVRRLPAPVTAWFYIKVMTYMNEHKRDFRIPPDESIPAYMLRWWWIPRNPFFNVYLHQVLRSDDDRALHDHPWWSFSLVLDGGYNEHRILEGGIHERKFYGPGAMKFRWTGRKAHRLELIPDMVDGDDAGPYQIGERDAITIFITGPVMRRWGFHADRFGWIDAYDWDAHCERHGIKAMRMDGGSQAAISERNRIA